MKRKYITPQSVAIPHSDVILMAGSGTSNGGGNGGVGTQTETKTDDPIDGGGDHENDYTLSKPVHFNVWDE